LSEYGVHIPLFVGGCIFLMIACGIYFFMKFVSANYELLCSDRESNRGDIDEPEKKSMVYIAWCSLFVSYFCIGVLNAVFPLIALKELQLSKSFVGLTMLVRSLAMGLTFAWLGMTSFWHFRFAPVVAGQLIGAIACLGLSWASVPYVVISCIGVIGCSAAMSYSASVYHSASHSRNKTRRMAIHESIIAISGVAGSSIGGIVYQYISARAVYYLCAICFVIVIGGQYAIKRLHSKVT
jgi:DHA1 family multidrug resistance protein-like MFS transporter/DHA1 family quinolone resistance protein-like MFS transporter